jgi:hypothetical protein
MAAKNKCSAKNDSPAKAARRLRRASNKEPQRQGCGSYQEISNNEISRNRGRLRLSRPDGGVHHHGGATTSIGGIGDLLSECLRLVDYKLLCEQASEGHGNRKRRLGKTKRIFWIFRTMKKLALAALAVAVLSFVPPAHAQTWYGMCGSDPYPSHFPVSNVHGCTWSIDALCSAWRNGTAVSARRANVRHKVRR